MSGFVGYDAERIAWLRDATRRAVEELVGLRSTDPSAATALGRIRRATATLGEVWLPVLGRLAEPPPSDISRADPRTREDDAWLAGVTELAERLAATDLLELLASDADLLLLAGQLAAIGSDPAAAAALRVAFSGWDTLVTTLAADALRSRSLLTADPDDAAATARLLLVDRVLAGVGAVLTAGSGQAHRPSPPPVLDDLDPYVAAMLLPHLDLSGVLLADTATRLVRRWHDWPAGTIGWMDTYVGGDNTADLVFRLLADDAVAATHFLASATERPELLFVGAQDPTSVDRLLTIGLDPTRVDATRAGSIIVPLIPWLRETEQVLSMAHDGGATASRAAIAGVLADWILYVGPRADHWAWTFEEGDAALRWVIQDDEALQRLLDGLLADQRTLGELPFADADGRIDDLLVSEQTFMFAQLEAAIEDERVADAVATEFWVDLAVGSAELLGGRLLRPAAAGIQAAARDKVVSTAAGAARRWLESQGLLPATPAQAAARADEDRNRRTVERAVIATVGVVGQLVDLGELDPAVLDGLRFDDLGDGCDVKEISERLRAWVGELEPQLSPEHLNLVIAVLNGFLNQGDVVDACV